MMVEIRDCTRLIAVGYFDKGSNSIAGILNFYHPDYKKYSLGKYLILKKIDYALGHGIEFYYTGYMSTIYTKFDYKLYPDTNAIEVWLPVEKEWTSYNLFSKDVMDYYFYRNIADL
jgi:arginine-tRNA-protein transferase